MENSLIRPLCTVQPDSVCLMLCCLSCSRHSGLFFLSVFSRYLLTEQSRLRSVNDIMPMIGARFYTQLDASQMRNDVIEEDLAKVEEFAAHALERR